MEREYILNYLKDVKKIADKRYSLEKDWQKRNRYFGVSLQITALIKNEHMYEDMELLQEAMEYERIKSLSDNL